MIRKLSILLLFFPVLIFAQEDFNYKRDFENILKETKNSRSDFSYDVLLEKYKKADTSLTDKQMLALLIGFTDNKFYKPYKDISFGRNLYEMNEHEKFDQAIKEGDEFLKTHPFDLKTLYETSYAYHKKGNEDIAQKYILQANLVFLGMLHSGPATTIETPMFALNPTDGQDFIRKFLKLKIGKMGSGSDKNGYFIDMLDAVLEDGTPKTLYFIIPHATKKMFE